MNFSLDGTILTVTTTAASNGPMNRTEQTLDKYFQEQKFNEERFGDNTLP
jgi:hypothetical protein